MLRDEGNGKMYRIQPTHRGVPRTRMSVLDPETMINAHTACRCIETENVRSDESGGSQTEEQVGHSGGGAILRSNAAHRG